MNAGAYGGEIKDVLLDAQVLTQDGEFLTLTAEELELSYRHSCIFEGSTFKRPEGYFAGKLIQDAGLKGYTVGGAQVSEKHSGFVINRGGATAEEVVFLIKQVQKKVMKQFNVMMQPEVRFIGFTDTEVRE